MNDIEKLIERLWAINCGSQGCQSTRDEAVDALKRLTRVAMPAEVEEAIRCCTEETRAITFAECARLLESLARENARLANNHHVQNRANAVLAKERDRLAAENAELQREVGAAWQPAQDWKKIADARAEEADRLGYVAALEALLQPPSGGEQAKCTTCGATDPLATPTCSNGFHAPKPAAEKA